MNRRLSLIAMLALLPAPALAADEHRLSAAEVERIFDQAAQKRETPVTKPVATIPAPARPIEGEVGVSVGSGGYREVFGTAVVPVGQEGVAIVSFDAAESRREFRRRR